MACYNLHGAFEPLYRHNIHKAVGQVLRAFHTRSHMIDNWLFSFGSDSVQSVSACLFSDKPRDIAGNNSLYKSCLVQGNCHNCYTLSCFSLFRTDRIFDIVSGAPEPFRSTLFNTTLSMPREIAHSTWVLYFFRYCFSAECSAFSSFTLFRFRSGIIVCVSILLLHLYCIAIRIQIYARICVIRKFLRMNVFKIFAPLFEKHLRKCHI